MMQQKLPLKLVIDVLVVDSFGTGELDRGARNDDDRAQLYNEKRSNQFSLIDVDLSSILFN